ncbi:MAG: GatB/YqeY domain-containing protein [Elusimicrobiota bacterium]|jgi:uncharacterized protein
MPAPLAGRLESDLKTALKAGEALRVSTLRLVLSALKYKAIQAGRELEDGDVLEVLSAEAKRRRESIAGFEQGGRAELAKKESDELAILSGYLPAGLSEEELKVLVAEAVTGTDARSPKDMGKVMSALMPRVKGRADGQLVSRLVKAALEG